MNSFFTFMEKHFIPIAAKIGSQRHLAAIRDSFVVSMPLMIFGSIGTLINTLPIKAYQNFMNNAFGEELWKSFGDALGQGSMSIMTIFIVFVLGYNLAKTYGKDALAAGVVSLSAFFIIGGIDGLNSKGLFIGIIVALLATELFVRLSSNKRLVVTMPDGVPPAVNKSFESLFPVGITMIVFAFAFLLLKVVGIPNIVESFYGSFQKPFMNMSTGVAAAIIMPFTIQLLWFFGLHGSNILGPFLETINVPAIEANVEALSLGQAAPYILNKPWNTAFVNLGGAGATLGLIIAIFIFGRRNKALTAVSSLSIAPGVFNINEPMTFGIPIVLNPILFIPYVFGPIVLSLLAYAATFLGFVPPATIVIPWNTPPIIGGILATQSWQGGVMAAINIVVITLIYVPFVILINRNDQKNPGEVVVD